MSLGSGGGKIIKNCSWKLRRGEQWVILGPQGSGKSAFAGIIAGIIPPSSGGIDYSFGTGGKYSGPRDFIAYSSFDSVLPTEDYFVQSRYWSGDDSPNVGGYLSLKSVYGINKFEIRELPVGEREYERRLGSVVRLLDIGRLLEKEFHQLSNGEARKVMLARVMLAGRKIIVLDDPFSGLDAAYRKRIAGIIAGLAAGGVQFVLAAEHESDIPECMTHYACFNCGSIERSGPVTELRKVKSVKMTDKGDNASSILPDLSGISGRHPVPVLMNNVSVRYGGKFILKNISWTVKKGERWCVSGPNGAGKTTLLSLILGDHPQAYSNDILIFGRQWGEGTVRSAIRRRIGWVSPELLNAFPLSESSLDTVCSGIFDTIGLYGKCRPGQRRRVLEWMQVLEIRSLAERPLDELSQGMQRLVLLARALVREPELLVLDEPFLGLDDRHARKAGDCIDHYCRLSGAALIYVTHENAGFLPGRFNNLNLSGGCIV